MFKVKMISTEKSAYTNKDIKWNILINNQLVGKTEIDTAKQMYKTQLNNGYTMFSPSQKSLKENIVKYLG